MLIRQLRGVVSFSLMVLNTFFWTTPLFAVALLRLLLPLPVWQRICRSVLAALGSAWITVNSFILRWISGARFQPSGIIRRSLKGSFLVIANHRSWADILILQTIFNARIPFLKFFLKQQLVWVPVLGLAWWALDFPFMKRYSKAYLKKHPEKAGKDFEATRRACERFKGIPVSVMNFAEGTRFRRDKQQRQKSPYQHLLKPKAGGAGYVLTMLGEHISTIMDVSIAYPQGIQSFWAFVCGKVVDVRVHVREIVVPEAIRGDYIHDAAVRRETQQWMNQLWQEKDRWIAQQLNSASTPQAQSSVAQSAS